MRIRNSTGISSDIPVLFFCFTMCVTYLLGAIGAGALVGMSFEANMGSVILAFLSKMVMSIGWASLYTFLNVIFRKYFGISIASSFFFGTGLPIIAVGMILGNNLGSILNIFLYGSSVYACLGATPVTLIVCLLVSMAWAVIYNVAGTRVLNKSDVY